MIRSTYYKIKSEWLLKSDKGNLRPAAWRHHCVTGQIEDTFCAATANIETNEHDMFPSITSKENAIAFNHWD